jgi:3-oxoacyl-[acyl-carrier protein] reductase
VSGAFEGRAVLVTGAGRGIGSAIAAALSEQGARTALLSRTASELESVRDQIVGRGFPEPAVVVANVGDTEKIGEAADRVVAEIGSVDVLVNNAGVVWPLGATVKVDPREWEDSFQVNVFAVLRLTQKLLPGMLERGWGRVVNVSTGAVAYPGGMVGGNAYVAGKAALEAHSVNLAAEVAGSGVTVNVFRPGAVDTAMQSWIREQDPEEIGADLHERFVTRHASGELLTPEDSAAALLAHLGAGGNGQIWDVP